MDGKGICIGKAGAKEWGWHMRMLVDSNMLRDDELREFLSKSGVNKIVVADYVMIEALKGDPLSKIFGLMKILCKFPKQVIVLKSMRSIGQLKGRRTGMTRRMIDRKQTKGLENWCAGLAKAEAGDEHYRRQLMKNGKHATEEMERIVANSRSYSELIEHEAKTYILSGLHHRYARI